MKKWILSILLIRICALAGDVVVSVQKVQQRWPWNGKVDIDYTVNYDKANEDIYVGFIGKDGAENRTFPLKTLEGDGANGVVKAGTHRVTWDMSVDEPKLHTGDFTVTIQAFTGAYPYMVVDLSGGTEVAKYPVRYSATPPDVSKDDCRTTELWLRLIFPGTFMMGSPAEELGRFSDENRHQVTLTKPFYIGVFEITQRQYQLIVGKNPSQFKGDTRPVDQVSYDMIRGTLNGASWPVSNQVDEESFLYVLRVKTLLLFDLPTEAQWEYVCRAGTNTALNTGINLSSTGLDNNLGELGRYVYNVNDGKGGYTSYSTKVGSYLPNAWGLYDMHGNVFEWCLDWYVYDLGTNASTDPVGGILGNYRVIRSGSWYPDASYCRAANRNNSVRGYKNPSSGIYNDFGFRLVCLPTVQ